MNNYYHLSLTNCWISLDSSGQQIEENTGIDNIFSDWNKSDVPGGAVGIIKEGQLIYAKGYGMGDLEHNIAITPTSVFYIASVSKQFVTFSILLLEEQGKLNLDDPIQKFLPDFPTYGTSLTIRHFIHHTSGVRDYLTLMALKGRSYLDEIEEEELYELIKRQKVLNFSPGEEYSYSNSCYFMLAMIVEKAAEKSLREFAEKNIFAPLGMKHTFFYDDNTELIKNRVFSYEKSEDKNRFNNLIMRFDLVGSGGVYSNIEDLYLWDQNFYHNKLGKGGQAIIEKMQEEGLMNNGERSGYAFALINGIYKGLKTVSHSGSLAGYRAQLMRFPEQHFSVIVLANRGDANPTSKSYKVADLLLKEKLIIEPKKEKVEANELNASTERTEFSLKQLTGQYEIESGVILELSLKSDNLHVVQNWNKSAYTIQNTVGNTFEIPGNASVQFTFSELEDELTQIMTIFQDGNKTICKRKKEIDLGEINLEAYTGNYYSGEIDVTYRFFLEEETLKVKIANNEPMDLSVNDSDEFLGEFTIIRFQREDGIINGFELDAGRVKNLKFEKI